MYSDARGTPDPNQDQHQPSYQNRKRHQPQDPNQDQRHEQEKVEKRDQNQVEVRSPDRDHDPELWLQRVIETMYRIDGSLDVADYRINGHVCELLLGGARPKRESLLVQHSEDSTNVALFIDDAVLLRARLFLHDRTRVEVESGSLDDFCVTAEGVSHFVYFTFCGERLDRPVSEVELEIQAEIDKYLVLRLMLPLPLPIPGAELVSRLYDRFDLHPDVPTRDRDRYVEANRLARRYARWFERRIQVGRTADALNDARALYRKPLAAKLAHIEAV